MLGYADLHGWADTPACDNCGLALEACKCGDAAKYAFNARPLGHPTPPAPKRMFPVVMRDDYCDDCGWDDVRRYGESQLCGVCAEEKGHLGVERKAA